ncbi:ERF family protein [Wielerella bovis]|uniref:ERF family protein n=1 Tax=Wielerella bovis TaxID=2917790 RepID=UPI0020186D2A|nr:ERF family protein [Wielerella bovis]MCG7657162.1 ERF family protein [Wielerella bovis]MCG7659385.1 ERF family protein [Wielerella bovis]ULJ60816.1 ERF family protein [Wielerella bovis]
MKNLHTKIKHIQQYLNAPKDAWNDFAKYHYRSAESILKAVKPLLDETELILTLSDTIEAHGDRVYVKATAIISDGEHSISTTALAREPQNKKGADDSQITGAASSYARKYALCGLFAIDDNKDADATNTHGKEPPPKPFDFQAALNCLNTANNLDQLQKYFKNAWQRADEAQKAQLKEIYDQRKADFIAAQQEQTT